MPTLFLAAKSDQVDHRELIEHFLQRWHACESTHHKQIQLVSEYQFHPERKWRFDFASMETRIAIELEGGIFRGKRVGKSLIPQGGHNTPTAIIKDCEKYNEAALLGWRVLRLCGSRHQTDSEQGRLLTFIYCERLYLSIAAELDIVGRGPAVAEPKATTSLF